MDLLHELHKILIISPHSLIHSKTPFYSQQKLGRLSEQRRWNMKYGNFASILSYFSVPECAIRCVNAPMKKEGFAEHCFVHTYYCSRDNPPVFGHFFTLIYIISFQRLSKLRAYPRKKKCLTFFMLTPLTFLYGFNFVLVCNHECASDILNGTKIHSYAGICRWEEKHCTEFVSWNSYHLGTCL